MALPAFFWLLWWQGVWLGSRAPAHLRAYTGAAASPLAAPDRPWPTMWAASFSPLSVGPWSKAQESWSKVCLGIDWFPARTLAEPQPSGRLDMLVSQSCIAQVYLRPAFLVLSLTPAPLCGPLALLRLPDLLEEISHLLWAVFLGAIVCLSSPNLCHFLSAGGS